MNANFHILILLLFIWSNNLAPSIGASGHSPLQDLPMDGGACNNDLAPSIYFVSGRSSSQGSSMDGWA